MPSMFVFMQLLYLYFLNNKNYKVKNKRDHLQITRIINKRNAWINNKIILLIDLMKTL